MRIGIMLRHIDQHEGGVKVYTRELLKMLIGQRGENELVLFYRNPERLGTFSMDGVTEVCIEAGTPFEWDQIRLPRALRRHGVDVVFNPKYSMPLNSPCPAVWVCHGLDWYVMPEASRWRDRLNHRLLIPRYARRAAAVIAVSEITRDHLMRFLNVPSERIRVIYPGLSDAFRARFSTDALSALRQRYALPERFLLYCGAVYPPKNFTRLIRAYARVGPKLGVPLIVAGGTNRFLSESELKEPQRLGIGSWVRNIGWVDHADLPGVYQLAQALLLPSLYESVGMPIMEAMASGCPVLTSNRLGMKELAGDAALLVEPESVDDIAHGIRQLLQDPALRERLRIAGIERTAQYTWQRTAAQTIEVLESVHARTSPATAFSTAVARHTIAPASAVGSANNVVTS